MNSITLVGRAGKDPEIKYGASGNATAKFSLAVDRGRKDANGNKITDWFNLVLFGKTAEIAGEYVKKGRQLAVSGAMQNNSYEKDGQKRDWWEVAVSSMTLLGDIQQAGGEGGQASPPPPPARRAPSAPPPALDDEIPF